MAERQPKSPQELGISNAEWVDMAESLLIARKFAALLPDSELGDYHRRMVIHLEQVFGLSGDGGIDNKAGDGIEL